MHAAAYSAVEHFDEGVYASNLYFGPPDYAYPQQKFYAPPLLPALIEAAMLARFPPNLAAILPSFLAGCATIVAIWSVGRSWFGPAVALSAATLVALSDFHIAYSTVALTDVLLGLWMVLAINAAARSLVAGDYRWAVGAGIYSGLAWWTKYNGWLPLAIEGAALPVLWLLIRDERARWTRWLGCFVVTAAVAIALWSPYYFSLLSTGGYAPIAANHSKYVVGFSGWMDSAARQISNQVLIERLFSPFSVGLAVALPGLLPGYGDWDRVWRGGASVALIVLSFVWSSFVVMGIGAAIGLVRIAKTSRNGPPGDVSPRTVVGFVFLLVWFAGLLMATPLYMAYPRLTLPWLLAAWLSMALNQADDLAEWELPSVSHLPTKWRSIAFSLVLVSLCLFPAIFFPRNFEPWPEPDRRGVLRVAQQIRAIETNKTARAVYIYGEPAMYFQLRVAGEELVAPVASLPATAVQIEGAVSPTYLIVGPHSETDSSFREQLNQSPNWRLVNRFAYKPSSLVLLDLHDVRTLSSTNGQPRHALEMYEFKAE